MLRIDETSGTLVAPQATALVTEAAPDRDELLALVGGSWEAFARELGFPALRLLAREPVAGVDLLAFDETAGRAVVVVVTGDVVEWQLGRALGAAAEVAGWDAARLAEVHEALSAAVPGDSPQLVLVAGGYHPSALATVEWLGRRHGMDVAAYTVAMVRFGAERLMTVHREPAEGPARDPAAEVSWLLTGAPAPAAAQHAHAPAPLASAPPPGA